MSKKIKQNRYSSTEFVEYGVLSALFEMYPESQVGLVAPQAQVAFDLAKEYLDKLHGTVTRLTKNEDSGGPKET